MGNTLGMEIMLAGQMNQFNPVLVGITTYHTSAININSELSAVGMV